MAVRNNAKKKQNGNAGLGCLALLALLLLVIGVVLFNRDAIGRAFKGTPFAEKMLPGTPAQNQKPAQTDAKQPAAKPETLPPAKPATTNTPTQNSPAAKEAPPSAVPKPAEKPAPEKPTVDKPASEKTSPEKPAPAVKTEPSKTAPAAKAPPVKSPDPKESAGKTASPEKPKTAARDRTLWFVKVESDGIISRVKSKRGFPVSDSPLADVLSALIEGPASAEKKKGYSTLIPEGVKLLSATVRGSTAYLNFNDAFQFNSYGAEGFAAQLRQIVWTATEFDSVKDVQILIEGRRVDYLGSEGIFIGSPLTRESF